MHFSSLARLAALAAVVLPVVFAGATRDVYGRDVADIVEDEYIVVYKDTVDAAGVAIHEAKIASWLSKRTSDGSSAHHTVGHKYNLTGFLGYHVKADPDTIAQIANAERIAYVEKDARFHLAGLITQSGSTYGLARISHREKGATDYIYDESAGEGTRAYVIDSGIYTAHEEFEGRAIWGTNLVTGTVNTDENGHGTHVSGTIGGKTFGVAKKTTLVAIKVTDANGDGSYSNVIAGIQWAVNNAQSLDVVQKSVINLSIAAGFSAAVNSAVAAAYNAGLPVIVAAGNEAQDASNDSPSSEPLAITVGAIGSGDNLATFSNFGADVDIFAPGVGIESAWIGSPDATQVMDGTSMSTPHVSGLAAYLIALEGLASPALVAECINRRATTGKITGLAAGTANLIAYNGDGA